MAEGRSNNQLQNEWQIARSYRYGVVMIIECTETTKLSAWLPA